MNIKYLIALSAFVLTGMQGLAHSSDLRMFLEESQGGGMVRYQFSSTDSNQDHFKSGFYSQVYGGDKAKIPMLYLYFNRDHTGGYTGQRLAGLLPSECNAYVPKNVTQLPPSQIQVFWCVSHQDFNAYCPHFAIKPEATARNYNSVHTVTVRIIGSDTGEVYLQKVDQIGGQRNDHDDAVVLDRIPASGPIEISQAQNKITIMHPKDDGLTVISPAPLLVKHTENSDSFWSVFEYDHKGQKRAIVGLHWIISYRDQSLGYLTETALMKMKSKGRMSKVDFIRELQELGRDGSFSGHGHIPKLLSLFRCDYSLARVGAAPFTRFGFSGFENTHVWSEGPEASVTVSLKGQEYPRPGQVSFLNTQGYITPTHSQTVDVFLNGAPVGRYVYKHGEQTRHSIDVPISSTLVGDSATIGFKFLNAVSPQSLGFANDTRQLAVKFDRVELAPLLKSNLEYSLARAGAAPFVRSGFSGFENTHVWSEGPEASVTVSLTGHDYPRPVQVSFLNTQGYITPTHSQTVDVFLNGASVGTYVYKHGEQTRHSIDVPISSSLTGDNAIIGFKFRNAASPQSLGLANDTRQLAVSFDKVELKPFTQTLFEYSLAREGAAPFERSGFSGYEGSYVWSEGGEARVTIPLTGQAYPRPKVIVFKGTSGFGTPTQPQEMDVRLNGAFIGAYQYKNGESWTTIRDVVIPAPMTGDSAIIDFRFHHPVSPKELGFGDDERKLAVKFNKVLLAL